METKQTTINRINIVIDCKDADGYTDAKTGFIREITNRAKEQITHPPKTE